MLYRRPLEAQRRPDISIIIIMIIISSSSSSTIVGITIDICCCAQERPAFASQAHSNYMFVLLLEEHDRIYYYCVPIYRIWALYRRPLEAPRRPDIDIIIIITIIIIIISSSSSIVSITINILLYCLCFAGPFQL